MRSNGPILSSVLLNSNFSSEQEESTISNAVKIYKKMPNTENMFDSNVGLAVGKIQSGKTANIITLTALALDNDYKVVIILLSDMNNLLDQNYERIKSSFANIKDVSVIKESKNGDFKTKDVNDLEYLYRQNKKLIICSLKHYKHINSISDKLKKSDFKNDYTLIIDDEGDDISQNTSKAKYGFDKFGKPIEEARSSNNKALHNLKTIFSRCGYLSVTATPEVQIFLQTFQSLAPNYCVTFEPGKGYCGLVTFHSKDSGLVEVVDDYQSTDDFNGIPCSLENAILYFICGCIIRKRRENTEFKHSMMIHNSKQIIKQQNLFSKIKTYIENLKCNVKKNNQSGQDFEEKLRPIYKKITLLDFNIEHDEILNVLCSMKVLNVNSKEDCNNLKELMDVLPYHIIIGGDMLDRGITIEGLAVSYIIRQSKIGQIDTILQRARWFGYKKSYIDLCKVYMPLLLSQQYTEIIESEDSIWNFLEQCSLLETDMRNQRCELVIDSEILKPASKSKVIYESDYGSFNLSQNIVQRHFVRNQELNKKNIQLFSKFNWNDATEYTKYRTNTQKHRYLEISIGKCIEIIRSFIFPDQNGDQVVVYDKNAMEKEIKKYYELIANDNSDSKVLLMDMRYETKEERSIKQGNQISGLLQGRNEKSKDDPEFYPGDGYLAEDNIILQIHHVILKDPYKDQYRIGDEVIMLCVNIPKKYTIKNIVRRKEILDSQREFC